MLIVLAEARFDPAQTETVRTAARPMIEASRAEPGCGGYDYAFDLLEPDLMRVRELWKDEQALKDHFATPHMAAFLKALRALRPRSLTVKCYELGRKGRCLACHPERSEGSHRRLQAAMRSFAALRMPVSPASRSCPSPRPPGSRPWP